MLTTTHVECEKCHNRTLVIVPMSSLPRKVEGDQSRFKTTEDDCAQMSFLETLGVVDSPLLDFIEAFRRSQGICYAPDGETDV